ncbi:MAG: aminotransferase class I/II-fold pyridoxal phosphate-dependent enzyme [Thermodesulfobacteriota bacterium]|nr:aminotransferase class I/II-fold pyridoxal phosphate-dependent enzyme [Thermodesulfobacteriota bacterium]
MQTSRFEQTLINKLAEIDANGALKGREKIITAIKPPENGKGSRYFIEGQGDKAFIRMNANAYLGLARDEGLVKAEEAAVRAYGTGPGAVRFISGTYQPHVELEKQLARFHNREAAMIFSSAYATIMGLLPSLIDSETAVISDALNHNCIINAMRLSRPLLKGIYAHLDMTELEARVKAAMGQAKRVLIVTDGIFSMRGDYAPLAAIADLASRYDAEFTEGILTVVDDSHGVGAFGKTGRGTIEYTGAQGVDILVATLGKAFGVNGGYLAASASIVAYLRETAPFYIYSNPITPGEAEAARKALDIIDSPEGQKRLEHLRTLTKRFEEGLVNLGFEVLRSEHPVVPLMIRDSARTKEIVQHLITNGILATGLNYPVVPKGDEEIRFQVSAEHTQADIDYVLDVLKDYQSD